jgi:acyl carrier protein
MKPLIRSILAKNARLPVDIETLADDADLHEAGLTSFASVNLMMALEEGFDIEFPAKMMNRRHFSSVNAIEAAIQSIKTGMAA